jgi:hypothetical protein
VAQGAYTAYLEVNVEGDYNQHYDDETYPTPEGNVGTYWAMAYGYPYRGQPSVVYAVDFHTLMPAPSGRRCPWDTARCTAKTERCAPWTAPSRTTRAWPLAAVRTGC